MQRILLLGVAGILLLSGGLGYWFVTRNTHGSGKVPSSGALGTQTGKLIQDTWEAAYYLDGSRAGNIHTEVREVASPRGRNSTTMW